MSSPEKSNATQPVETKESTETPNSSAGIPINIDSQSDDNTEAPTGSDSSVDDSSVESTDKTPETPKIDEGTANNLRDFYENLSGMSNVELLEKFIKIMQELFDKLKVGIDISALVNANKESSDDTKELKVDFSLVDENETFTSENKDVEYISKVLNIEFDSNQNTNGFLEKLKTDYNCSLNTEKDLSKLKVGDILFFHDGNDLNTAKKTAIVTGSEAPYKMKLCGDDGKIQEVTIEESSLFNNWYGFVRIPEKTIDSNTDTQTDTSTDESESVNDDSTDTSLDQSATTSDQSSPTSTSTDQTDSNVDKSI